MRIYIFLFLLHLDILAWSNCIVTGASPQSTLNLHDPLIKLLRNQIDCPTNVQQLTILLNQIGPRKSYMVANRGRNNSSLGSFSFFESIFTQNKPELFIGHFTDVLNNQLVLNQVNQPGALLIELIAWDSVKNMYNFYELIGQQPKPIWFYRGDSSDIWSDNVMIYRGQGSSPTIGNRLRCSGCHVSGGPIMKEIEFPHNDWFLPKRPLLFSQSLSSDVSQYVKSLRSASELAAEVSWGMDRLYSAPSFRNFLMSAGPQVALRPLFCDMEINLASDNQPFEQSQLIQIPSASILNPFFGALNFTINVNQYKQFLSQYRLRFPENGDHDADHAWLTPVKGRADLVQIKQLVQLGYISTKFVADILATGGQGEMFNKERCDLLKLIPNTTNWMTGFAQNLQRAGSTASLDLYKRMSDASWTLERYQTTFQQMYQQKVTAEKLFPLLLKNRSAVRQAEISKNPRGEILEPGFRVIFPEVNGH